LGLGFLLDRSGKLVREFRFAPTGSSTDVRLDVSDLARGVYVLRMILDGVPYVRTVVKI
jgi:hypothetical protein